MAFRILVPMDDSKMARGALEYALENHPEADITVLHVAGGPSSMMGAAAGLALAEDYEETAEQHAEKVFEDARKTAEEYGIEISTMVEVGHPARAIVNSAEAFDTVILGSHSGSLVDRLVVGNVAQKVFRQSPVPVTVVR